MVVAARKPYLFDLLLLTVVIIWGFNFPIIKLIYLSFHPLAFNAVRFVVASVMMTALLKLRGASLDMDRADAGSIFKIGFISNTCYQFLFVLGLQRTKAGNAGLLMALTPIFAYLIGVFTKRERFSPGLLSGIVLSLAGVSTIVLFGSSEISFAGTWRGDVLIIAAAFCWGWYSTESAKLLGKYGALRLTVLTMIAGTAILLPLSIPWLVRQNWSPITSTAWAGFAFSTLLAIVYSYFVWAYALSRIGVAHTAIYSNVTPIIAVLASWPLLGERPSMTQLLGVILVLTGVFMVRSRKPSPIP